MSVASSPIGGRSFAAGARALITLRNSGRHGRRIQTAINRAKEDLDLKVTVSRTDGDTEVPVWERTESGSKVVRLPRSATTWTEELVSRIVQEQPEERSYAPLAVRYAAEAGRSVETVRKQLKESIELAEGRWVRRPSSQAA
ncbi:hypothetical protein ACIQU5_00580 [Streptomyces sp. NPDC090306]|uniref:hypothetical protein n=1 Tax=Streptomyces sp. NPDC090306 TaxID=3365961 RepID=UPI003828D2F9